VVKESYLHGDAALLFSGCGWGADFNAVQGKMPTGNLYLFLDIGKLKLLHDILT
jgi:hypothetical protein